MLICSLIVFPPPTKQDTEIALLWRMPCEFCNVRLDSTLKQPSSQFEERGVMRGQTLTAPPGLILRSWGGGGGGVHPVQLTSSRRTWEEEMGQEERPCQKAASPSFW